MSDYTIRISRHAPYDETVTAVRDALAEQGFGIITEIDLAATLGAKLGVGVPAEVILGACRPQLAHRAIAAEPAVATMLPCNVVVRADGEDTVVEAFDPAAMTRFEAAPAIIEVADDARARLAAALTSLTAQED